MVITYQLDLDKRSVSGNDAEEFAAMILSLEGCTPYKGLQFSIFGRKFTILNIEE